MNQLAILNKILERTKGFFADLKADTVPPPARTRGTGRGRRRGGHRGR